MLDVMPPRSRSDGTPQPAVRDRLLDAVDQHLFVTGAIGTPVDAILRAAGASPPSLYKHFGSKTGLITAALQRRLEIWSTVWQEEIDATSHPVRRVLSVYPAMRRYQQEHLQEKWCAFSGTRAAVPQRTPELQQVLDAETELLRSRHAELVAGLGLGPKASATLTSQLVVVYNGLLAQMLREPYEEAIDDAEATALALVESALARRPRGGVTARARESR